MIVGVSLGGNLPGARKAIESCALMLAESSFFRLTGISSLSRTLAWGTPAPSYDNLVVVGETRLGIRGFFQWLNVLERKVPRRGKGHVWPRVLDVDFLFFLPVSVVNDPDLRLPHPALPDRPFLRQLLVEAFWQGHLPPEDREMLTSLPLSFPRPTGSFPVRPPGRRIRKGAFFR